LPCEVLFKSNRLAIIVYVEVYKEMEILLIIISGIVILVGLAGTVLPFLPGPPLALAGLLLYGFVSNFETMSVSWIIALSVLTLLTFILDVFGPALVARGYKASAYGSWGAVIGAVLGVFVLGPIGIVLGPIVGAFLGEIIHGTTHRQAFRAAVGAFVGVLVGTLFKIIVTLMILVYFVISIIRSIA
jgi:hypothetical protein